MILNDYTKKVSLWVQNAGMSFSVAATAGAMHGVVTQMKCRMRVLNSRRRLGKPSDRRYAM